MRRKTLIVGNLDYSTTAQGIEECFSPYGVDNIRLSEGRGFAFIEVDESKSEFAISEREGSLLDGREIEVGYARSKMRM